jgi:hypothetical protein
VIKAIPARQVRRVYRVSRDYAVKQVFRGLKVILAQ